MVKASASGHPIVVAATDSLNLAGIITPGPRISPLAVQTVEVLAG